MDRDWGQEPARRMLAEQTDGMGRGSDAKPEAPRNVLPKRNPPRAHEGWTGQGWRLRPARRSPLGQTHEAWCP